MSDEKITDPTYPGYVYVGGPRDGQNVLFQPGWPPPSAMEHARWPLHRYELEPETKRYVWKRRPDPKQLPS
jgi:hypothetical protein